MKKIILLIVTLTFIFSFSAISFAVDNQGLESQRVQKTEKDKTIKKDIKVRKHKQVRKAKKIKKIKKTKKNNRLESKKTD